jgi:hypothetical protein
LDAVGPTSRGDVAPALSQHPHSEVQANHVCGRAICKLQCDAGGSGGNIENYARRRRRNPIDHCPAPSAVLAHGENFGQAVVALRKRRKQPLRESVAIARDIGEHQPS